MPRIPHNRPLTHDEASGAPFAPDLHDARHLWLKAGLLLVWALVSFGTCYFARDLQFQVGPWPLNYWIAAQGAVLMFIVIVGVYCAAMNHFERQDERQGRAGAAANADLNTSVSGND